MKKVYSIIVGILMYAGFVSAGTTEEITKYTVEMDFEIITQAFGPIFGAEDVSNFYMWQISTYYNPPRLRPHSWRNGGAAGHGDISIPTTTIDIQSGVVYTIRIEVDGDLASTYIDNVLVDADRVNPRGGNYGYGKVGFRTSDTEKSVVDRVTVTAWVGGQWEIMYDYDFSTMTTSPFTNSTVTDGRLYPDVNKISVLRSAEDIKSECSVYTIEMDFKVDNSCAGPIFGADDENNFYMWQIIPNGGSTQLKPHIRSGGGFNAFAGDIDISSLVSIQQGEEHKLRLVVNGNTVSTYIDNISVDENRTHPSGGNYNYGRRGIGFRQNDQEAAYYDNIKITTVIDGVTKTVKEDFSNPSDFAFTYGTVEDGWLYVKGNFSWEDNLPEVSNTPTGIDRTDANGKYTVWSENGNLCVSGLSTGVSVSVYTPEGKLISSFNAVNNSVVTPLPAKGFYIIRMIENGNTFTTKLMAN